MDKIVTYHQQDILLIMDFQQIGLLLDILRQLNMGPLVHLILPVDILMDTDTLAGHLQQEDMEVFQLQIGLIIQHLVRMEDLVTGLEHPYIILDRILQGMGRIQDLGRGGCIIIEDIIKFTNHGTKFRCLYIILYVISCYIILYFIS